MISKRKQRKMVLQHDRATTPVGDHSSAGGQMWPSRARDGLMEQAIQVTSHESDSHGNMGPSKEAIGRSSGRSNRLVTPSFKTDNLSADVSCNGIKVTLDNNVMWNEFHRCKTEMILTKQGSRMFPYCRFRLSGLKPSQRYSLIMDIQPMDNCRYRWTGKSWQTAGRAEVHTRSEPFTHPDSPALGQHWMQSPVSFFRMKLTNDLSDQERNTILYPMHRYLPRLHVVPIEKAAKDLNGPGVVTFTFPQTEFMAVTTYQNTQFAQLKIGCNPFTKGLKEDNCRLLGLKLKTNSISESNKNELCSDNEQHPIKKSLKFLLANHKPKSSKTLDSKLSAPEDPERQTPTSRNQSTSRVAEEDSGSIGPKLFSELMRDAHVSLQRCDTDKLNVNCNSSPRVDRSNTKTNCIRSNGLGFVQEQSSSTKTITKNDKGIAPAIKVPEEVPSINELDSNDSIKTNSLFAATSKDTQTSSKELDHKSNADLSSEDKMLKQQKRPPRLPLPALALFLKQHSTKSKKSKPESFLRGLPSEQKPITSPAASVCLQSDLTSAAIDLKGETSDCNILVTKESCGVHSNQGTLKGNLLTYETDSERSTIPSTASDAIQLSIDNGPVSLTDRYGQDPIVSESTELPGLNPACCTDMCATKTSPTSSPYPIVTPPCTSVLPVPSFTQTPTHSSTLHSDSGSLKVDSLLPDPSCSSFSFDLLSPASSPGQLPHLPGSLAFQLDSTASEAGQTVEPADDSSQEKVSSVFQWHTVLPPPQPYIGPSFTTFLPNQNVPLMSPSPPLLPTSSSHPEAQNLSITMLSPDPPPSFQETEQSLPFPTELSPLTLQMSLSPSFSPLDGEGLSPTPSLTDLVHFFSSDDLGMEFSNTEVVMAPGMSLPVIDAQEPLRGLESAPTSKTCKRKKSQRRKLPKMDLELAADEAAYQSMQPNLEKVEEQLFVSFTSKEALKLHIVDSSVEPVPEPQTVPDDWQTAENPENDIPHVAIVQFEENLLRDLKLMKHRQVIHPVLQEVGLKMNLLDPMLSIDLEYLGVRLPLPAPGAQVEPVSQEPPTPEPAFVSRTGKTTDVTQIKGWREKFSSTEAIPATCTSEVSPSLEPQKKKNLSAFCSDMLDEYLENEGRLIDERAASFSQPPVELPVYQLPTQSSSYVRTLDHVLKKQVSTNPAADLISGFVPPSRRPRPPLARVGRRKPRRLKAKAGSAAGPEGPEPSTAGLENDPVKPADQTATAQLPEPTILKRRRFKPRTTTPPPSLEHMAPLESDSELALDCRKTKRRIRKGCIAPVTRAVLKQKDLEDAAMWEGQPRNGITEERANVALMSLFTLTGFVCEDPLAPVQLKRRQSVCCLNDFCRLGCVCSSLLNNRRPQHCGRPSCMFGCTCLKQKVVLLKNLDGSDCGPGGQPSGKKRRRRMKMAYVLKETDSVSNPADRVKALWRRGASEDADPDPVHVPETSLQPNTSLPNSNPRVAKSTKSTLKDKQRSGSSCARVRAYNRKSKTEGVKTGTNLPKQLKENKRQTDAPPCAEIPACPAVMPCNSSPADQPPKPSKRLFILANCQWGNGDRSLVLKQLCEAMAQDQLDQPFWIKDYFISPTARTVEGNTEPCTHYKVHISKPMDKGQDPQTPGAAEPVNTPGGLWLPRRKPPSNQQDNLSQVSQRKKSSEQRNDTVEDWQRAVEEAELEEEKYGDVEEEIKVKDKYEEEKEKIWVPKGAEMIKEMVEDLAIPFLTGLSPAGFLSATKKQPGGSSDLVQVNGKFYPMAKIQLGMMGALHPANRLAAYLTGRVVPGRRSQTPTSPSHPAESSGNGAPCPLSVPTSSLTPVPAQTSLTVSSVPHPPTPKSANLMKISVPGAPRSNWFQPASFTGQKVLLEPVPTTSGAQDYMTTGSTYYRRPDGKLVQVFINNVTNFGPQNSTQKDAAATQPPVVTDLSINPHLTQGKPVSASLSNSTLGQSLTGLPDDSKRSAPIGNNHIPPGHLVSITAPPPQSSSKTAILVPPPPSVNVSVTPVLGQGLEPDVTTVMSHQQKTASIETSQVPHPLTPVPPALPTLNFEPGEVDGPFSTKIQHVEVEVELNQGSETDNLSDTDSMMKEDLQIMKEEQQEEDREDLQVDVEEWLQMGLEELEELQEECNTKEKHNLLEKQRRHQMYRRFERLRHHVRATSPRLSKIATLHKAVQVIKHLQQVEKVLLEKKRRLKRWREKLLVSCSGCLPGRVQARSREERPGGHDVEEPANDALRSSSEEERRITKTRHDKRKKDSQKSAGERVAHVEGGDTSQNNSMMSSHLQAALQTPPTPASTPPTPTLDLPTLPVVLAASTVEMPTPTSGPPPRWKSNVSPVKKCQRTIPNILSRSKKLKHPHPTSKDTVAFLRPVDILTPIVLPGQPFLAVGPTMFLSTQAQGLASSTLDVPRLTNEGLCLTALPHPQTEPNINCLSPAPPVEVSDLKSSVEPSLMHQCAERLAVNRAGDPPGGSGVNLGISQGTLKGTDSETWASLLNGLVFLNEQTVAVTTPAAPLPTNHGSVVGGASKQGQIYSPQVLQLGLVEPVATEIDGAKLDRYAHIGLDNASAKAGVLTPPPLLQMKMGGAKVADLSSCEEGKTQEGIAWRPMPRLVPLGLRGNPAP